MEAHEAESRRIIFGMGCLVVVLLLGGCSSAVSHESNTQPSAAATVTAEASAAVVMPTVGTDTHPPAEPVPTLPTAPPDGTHASAIDLGPFRESMEQLGLRVDRLEVVQNGEFGLGWIDGALIEPVSGNYVAFTLDPNAVGIVTYRVPTELYEEAEIAGYRGYRYENEFDLKVIAQNADGSSVVSLVVGAPGPEDERSQELRDLAESTILPALLELEPAAG